MSAHDSDKKKVASGRLRSSGPDESKEGKEPDAGCRCKEAEGKTFVQLLKVMVKDLLFWKSDNR